MALLQLRFALVCLVVVLASMAVHRWLHVHRRIAARLACAAIAGLATGLVAGGMAVAVEGTPWALWGTSGDNAWIFSWVKKLQEHQSIPNYYPPVIFYVTWAWANLSRQPIGYAYQGIQFIGTALYGPLAYLMWRLTLPPAWALGIGVSAALPFVEPVKPYPQLSLVLLIPLLVKFLQVTRLLTGSSARPAIGLGVCFGASFGALFLLYSGWFVWIAVGVFIAYLLVAPWSRAPRAVIPFSIAVAVTFTAVAWVHLRGLLDGSGGTSDRYFYFDTNTDPTYVAMWRNDRGLGSGSIWPPLGEYAGVGVFTLLLAAGLFVALLLAWRRTIVLCLGLCIASAWLARMWIAGQSYETNSVRLYPRTTMVILYCLLLFVGFAIYSMFQYFRANPRNFRTTAPLGLLLIPLIFVYASAGSATIDKYMPVNQVNSPGWFTYLAQTERLVDGSCSTYARQHGTASVVASGGRITGQVKCPPSADAVATTNAVRRP